MQEVNKLIEAPSQKIPFGIRDKAILEVLYGTGIRVGELVNLNIGDIDFNEKIIKVLGKGSKERILPLSNISIRAIQEYLKNRNLFNKSKFIKMNDKDALFLNR
ncbi:unnamed protein product, partial [marine sediment metagenome]